MKYKKLFSLFPILSTMLTLTSCSDMMLNGQFVPTGTSTGSFQYFGHTFDIVPAFGKTDLIVLRGTQSILDSELHNVRIIAQRTYLNETIIVLQGQRYSGDYLPTWEILTASPHTLHINAIPANGGNPPFTFSFNQDGLEIHSSDGPGLFFKEKSFYSLPRYYAAKQHGAPHYNQSYNAGPSHTAHLHFVDDVKRVQGSGIKGFDTQNQSVNLQN